MRIRIQLLKIFLVFLWLVLLTPGSECYAQTTASQLSPLRKDTTLAVKKEHGFFAFFTRLFHKPEKKVQQDTGSLATKKADSTTIAKKNINPNLTLPKAA